MYTFICIDTPNWKAPIIPYCNRKTQLLSRQPNRLGPNATKDDRQMFLAQPLSVCQITWHGELHNGELFYDVTARVGCHWSESLCVYAWKWESRNTNVGSVKSLRSCVETRELCSVLFHVRSPAWYFSGAFWGPKDVFCHVRCGFLVVKVSLGYSLSEVSRCLQVRV